MVIRPWPRSIPAPRTSSRARVSWRPSIPERFPSTTGDAMTDATATEISALPAHVQLINMARGATVAAIIHAAAKFGLADQLASGPKTAEEVAGPTRTHAPSL